MCPRRIRCETILRATPQDIFFRRLPIIAKEDMCAVQDFCVGQQTCLMPNHQQRLIKKTVNKVFWGTILAKDDEMLEELKKITRLSLEPKAGSASLATAERTLERIQRLHIKIQSHGPRSRFHPRSSIWAFSFRRLVKDLIMPLPGLQYLDLRT